MSLYSALRAGVSSINANSQRMGMISDNVVNSNSTGYKRVDASFSSFVDGNVGNNSSYMSSGVSAIGSRKAGAQGQLEATAFATDLAISGNGYFAVATEVRLNEQAEYEAVGQTLFTRSGEFRADNNGNLRNSDGYYLLSWPSSSAASLGDEFEESNDNASLRAANVYGKSFSPIATTDISVGLNITPTTSAGADSAFSVSQTVVDAQGDSKELVLSFEKNPAATHMIFFNDGTTTTAKEVSFTTQDSWRAYANIEGASIQTFDADGNSTGIVTDDTHVPIADLVFDANGRLSTMTTAGATNTYKRTLFPLSFDGPNQAAFREAGSAQNAPYTLPTNATLLEQVRDALVASDVPASTFSATPTRTEIITGITLLDTQANPDTMFDIMARFGDVQAFHNTAERENAGLPIPGAGIDQLLLDVNPVAGAVNASADRIGAVGLGQAEDSTSFLAGRIVGSDDGAVKILTSADTDIGTKLQRYADNANDKLRITVDYDNTSSSADGNVDIDINLGSMTLEVLQADNILNRTNNGIDVSGAGGPGNDGVTQYDDGISTLRYYEHDGKRFSSLDTVRVTDAGVLEGLYDNGEIRNLYKIPLAIFSNPNGLTLVNGNVFADSQQSGNALLHPANITGAGRIAGNVRESANVELAEEFSNMIITQRSYSAATKVVTTTDAMLDELNRAVR